MDTAVNINIPEFILDPLLDDTFSKDSLSYIICSLLADEDLNSCHEIVDVKVSILELFIHVGL